MDLINIETYIVKSQVKARESTIDTVMQNFETSNFKKYLSETLWSDITVHKNPDNSIDVRAWNTSVGKITIHDDTIRYAGAVGVGEIKYLSSKKQLDSNSNIPFDLASNSNTNLRYKLPENMPGGVNVKNKELHELLTSLNLGDDITLPGIELSSLYSFSGERALWGPKENKYQIHLYKGHRGIGGFFFNIENDSLKVNSFYKMAGNYAENAVGKDLDKCLIIVSAMIAKAYNLKLEILEDAKQPLREAHVNLPINQLAESVGMEYNPNNNYYVLHPKSNLLESLK